MVSDFPAPPRVDRRANAFPKILFWGLIVASIVGAYLLWLFGTTLYRGDKQSNVAVHRFHQELNNGQYEQIYQETDAGFRAATTHDDAMKLFQSVHTKLGDAAAESITGLNIHSNAKGTFIVTSYTSKFSGGKAEETFTWLRKGSDLTLDTYNIQSSVFGTQ